MSKGDQMKVLVTGGQGYVGAVLAPHLVDKGYNVTVLDRGFFLNNAIRENFERLGIKSLKEDIRFFEPGFLKGMDAVVDLAALSNDPAGELDQLKTLDINYLGRSRVARLSKAVGVERYVLASSCSTYGFQEDIVDETSPINPLTTYARANYLAESDNLPLSDDRFHPVALRFATAFGYSDRLRLDIAINAMTYNSINQGKVRLMRDGKQFRPFVHVRDMARAIEKVLAADQDIVSGEVFNVGSDNQNVMLEDVAETVIKLTGSANDIEWYGDPDTRSYKVSFSKMKKKLGFDCKYSIDYGVKEMSEKFRDSSFEFREDMMTVEHYKKIMESERTMRSAGYNLSSRTI